MRPDATGNLVVRGVLAVVVILSGVALDYVNSNPRNGAMPVGNDPAWHDDIPVNQWVPVPVDLRWLPGYRADHSGLAYVPGRNSIVYFGADTHQRDYSNAVTEIALDSLEVTQPYRAVPRYTLRTDNEGRRVAGAAGDKPWPMHVYDALQYDAGRQRVLLLSGAQHSMLPAHGSQRDPLWAYDPDSQRWQIVEQAESAERNFFAAGSASWREPGGVVAYAALKARTPFLALASEDTLERSGAWLLPPDTSEWQELDEASHHWGWFNAVHDTGEQQLLVFGGHAQDPSIWALDTARTPGAAGWERRLPAGATCPGGHYFPAAYAASHGLTLFLPFDRTQQRQLSCLYDAARNQTWRLPEATLPRLGLNYSLVYAERADLFVLLTGSFSRGQPTALFALRLDTERLPVDNTVPENTR